MIGIIGGSGIYDPTMLKDARDLEVNTPFGSVNITVGMYGEKDMAFLPRHGSSHSVPPHLINYRANIWALHSIGVERIVSTSASGSLNASISPGSFVVLSNFLDFTKTRANTFYDGSESIIDDKDVVHIDVTQPYCPELRDILIKTGKEQNLPIVGDGIYVCTEGPRFESAAEIKMFSRLGGDVVGMTNLPEVILARELEMCYSSIAMVTNYAAGISEKKLTHKEVLDIMENNLGDIKLLLEGAIPKIPDKRSCQCSSLLDGAKGK